MGRTTNSTLALFVGAVLGIITALHGLGNFGLKPVPGASRWAQWQVGGNDTFQIYALGHFLSEGQLPPPKSSASYLRSVDDEGNSLRADCIYFVDGTLPPSRWWSMTVADGRGSEPRSELTAGEAITSQSGELRVTISARPMPGNWIMPPNSSNLTLSFVVNEAVPGYDIALPAIKKASC
ncbi:MAG: DUF1214 domain-containing protein [Alphaproteobacteria bacterium]|nr:DUF1214 domain-containing protein [Alphaproteobacteria bacterium]